MIVKLFFELKYEILIADLTDIGGGDFEVTLPRTPDRITTFNGMEVTFSLKPGTENVYVLEATTSQNFIAYMAFYFNDSTYLIEDKNPESATGTLVEWQPRINQNVQIKRENKRIFQSNLAISSSQVNLLNGDFKLDDILGIKYKHINNPVKIYFDDVKVFEGVISGINSSYNVINLRYKDGLFNLRKYPTFGDTISESVATKAFYPNIAPQNDGFGIPFISGYHTPNLTMIVGSENTVFGNVSPYGNITQDYPGPRQRFVGINTNYTAGQSTTLNHNFVLCKTPAPISTGLLSYATASFQDISLGVFITLTVVPFGLFAGDQVRLNANSDQEVIVLWVNYADRVIATTGSSPTGLTSVDKHPFQFYFYRYGPDANPTSISPLFETYADKLVTGAGAIFNPVGSPGASVPADIDRVEPDTQVGQRTNVLKILASVAGPLGILAGVLKDGSIIYKPASIGPAAIFEANADNIIDRSFSVSTDFQDVYSELTFFNRDGALTREAEWQATFTNTLVDDYYETETTIEVDHPYKLASSAQTRAKLLTATQALWYSFSMPKLFVADLGDVIQINLQGYNTKVFVISVTETRDTFSYIGQQLDEEL